MVSSLFVLRGCRGGAELPGGWSYVLVVVLLVVGCLRVWDRRYSTSYSVLPASAVFHS